MARVFEVALLDRLRPLEQLLHLRLAGHLVHGAHDLHVPELAGLGHDQELEPVEAVGVVAEVVLHHLLGFVLRLASFVLDRGLLAVELARVLFTALLRLRRLLAHAPEQARDLLIGDKLGDLGRRLLRRLREAVHLCQLLLELRQLGHALSWFYRRLFRLPGAWAREQAGRTCARCTRSSTPRWRSRPPQTAES